MKKSIILSVVLLMGMTTLVAQDGFKMPAPTKEHEFLKQFIGGWDTDMEAIMAPGQPPIKCKGNMSSKAIGPFWQAKTCSTPARTFDLALLARATFFAIGRPAGFLR